MRMSQEKITIDLGKNSYDIMLEYGCLDRVGELLDLNRKVLVVTDSGVPAEYADAVAAASLAAEVIRIPQGESSKDFSNFHMILSRMLAFGMGRGDCVAAVGGGVTGDMSGFAAACYMRGIDFYNIPTTVLSQVDSSIGGKTAVDLDGVKNVVGAFYQPSLVLFDTDFMKTLPYDEIRNGLGEGVKYAVLEGGAIFDILSEGLTSENLEDFIYLCVDAKRRIVEADEKEGGKRKLLNLGHTVAHAVEALTEFVVPHGVAVAYGVRVMARLASQRGELPEEEFYKIEELLLSNDLGLELNPIEELIPHFVADKKRAGDRLTLVTIAGIGDCRLTEIPVAEAGAYFMVE